jgi:hypothetical protein
MGRTFVKCKLVEKEKNQTELRLAKSLEIARKDNQKYEEKRKKQAIEK